MSSREEDNRHEKQTPGPSSGTETLDNPDGIAGNSFFASADDSSPPKKRRLPPWLDHFNARDLKELFKCSIAVWIVTLFIVIDPVLRAEGQAMFFGWYASCLVNFSQSLTSNPV
jgi:hypothetical protein